MELDEKGSAWIGQPTYTKNVLEKFRMKDCKPVATPVDVGTKLQKKTNVLISSNISQQSGV